MTRLIVSSMLVATCIILVNSLTTKEDHERATPRATLPTTTTPPPVYYLPSGVELVVGDFRSTFRCDNRTYGYYADQDNNCQIFHVCAPFIPAMYSFFCGNQTVFDQSHLVCTHPSDALPCEEAHNFYHINDNFGREDVPFLQK